MEVKYLISPFFHCFLGDGICHSFLAKQLITPWCKRTSFSPFVLKGTKKLECTLPDGTGRRVIHNNLKYPFSIVSYADHFYHTDWRRWAPHILDKPEKANCSRGHATCFTKSQYVNLLSKTSEAFVLSPPHWQIRSFKDVSFHPFMFLKSSFYFTQKLNGIDHI